MVFKRFLVTTSVTALFLSAPTMAASAADMPAKAPRVTEQAQPVSGYVELYGGWARSTFDDTACSSGFCGTFSESANGWVLGGAGRVTYWWAPNYSIQLDAQGEGTSYRLTPGNSFFQASSHAYLIGGHANWRDPGRGLIGIFGGAGDTTTAFGISSIRHGLIGAEGQAYWGPLTLYGQAGYTSTFGSLAPDLDSVHAWFVRGTARVYINPNFRLEGTVFYADGDLSFSGTAPAGVTESFETWLWRAKAEHKFAARPLSVFLAYEGSQSETNFELASAGFSSTVKATDHRVTAGIRLYLGENTLQWNDNHGTTLDIIAPLSVPARQFGMRTP